MSLYTANAVSAAAIPSLHDGRTREVRNSMYGAIIAAKHAAAKGVLTLTEDSLRVDPQSTGSELWDWVQPVLSAGGHILGAPAVTERSETDVLKMGIDIITGIYEGHTYASKRPEHAIPVLCVLAATMKDRHHIVSRNLGKKLLSVLGYAEEPPFDVDPGTDYSTRFIESIAHPWVREGLSRVDLVLLAKNPGLAPSWKEIKKAFPKGGCSNSKARYIRRAMLSYWPKKRSKMQIRTLRDECHKPIEMSNRLADYLSRCWALRTSSISSRLPKTPPDVVRNALRSYGVIGQCQDPMMLRASIIKKFEAFEQWAHLQHGADSNDPTDWSDTLSKFASSINPFVKQYNEAVGRIELMQATSFVPGDLAPEMYGQERETGYFFLGQGMCYSYSAAWRRDAYCAYLQGRLPDSVDALKHKDKSRIMKAVSTDLAHRGGLTLLRALAGAGVSEEEFTRFLRQYYWSSAFLFINLHTQIDDWTIVDTDGSTTMRG